MLARGVVLDGTAQSDDATFLVANKFVAQQHVESRAVLVHVLPLEKVAGRDLAGEFAAQAGDNLGGTGGKTGDVAAEHFRLGVAQQLELGAVDAADAALGVELVIPGGGVVEEFAEALLAFAQRVLVAFLGGDVGVRTAESDDVPMFVVQRGDGALEPVIRAVLRAVADFAGPRAAARHGGVHLAPEYRGMVTRVENAVMLPDELPGRVAAHPAERGVDVNDPVLGIGFRDESVLVEDLLLPPELGQGGLKLPLGGITVAVADNQPIPKQRRDQQYHGDGVHQQRRALAHVGQLGESEADQGFRQQHSQQAPQKQTDVGIRGGELGHHPFHRLRPASA